VSRFLRFFAALLAFVLVVSGVGIWYMYQRLNESIRQQLRHGAGSILGAEATIASLVFNPWNGEMRIADVHLGNPAGYPGGDALVLREIRLRIDPASLGTPALRVWRADAEGLQLRLVESPAGEINLERLLENARDARDAGSAGGQLSISEYNAIDLQADFDTRLGTASAVGLADQRVTGLGSDSGGLSPASLAISLLRPLVAATLEEGRTLGVLDAQPATRQTFRDLRDLIEAIAPPPGASPDADEEPGEAGLP